MESKIKNAIFDALKSELLTDINFEKDDIKIFKSRPDNASKGEYYSPIVSILSAKSSLSVTEISEELIKNICMDNIEKIKFE